MPEARSNSQAVVPGNEHTQFPLLYDRRFPVHTIAPRLEPFIRVIVEKVHPEKIILFGSYAYGQPNENSDVDLLVVRQDIESEKASNLEIREAFWTVPGPLFSFTILSKTPEELAERLAEQDPFFEDITGQGLVLYAAQKNPGK